MTQNAAEGIKPAQQSSSRPLSLGRAEQGGLAGVATLSVIEERVAMLLSQQLEGVLQASLTCSAEEATLQKWSDAQSELQDPGCHALLEIEAMSGHAIVSIDHELFFAMLERVFGAQGAPRAHEPRLRHSAIEQRVFKRLLRSLAHAMEQAWKPIVPIHMNTLRVDTRSNNVAITSPNEPVVVSRYVVDLGEVSGTIRVLVPKVTLWRYKELLAMGRYEVALEPERDVRAHLERALKRVELPVSAELGRAQISLEQLSQLAVGDVLRLDRAPDAPTLVHVAGLSKFLAHTTVSHGQIAVSLSHPLFPTEP